MDIIQDILTAVSTIPVAKKTGSEANQFWDTISFLFPLLIIVFFWLIGRRSRQNAQTQQTQQTEKPTMSLNDVLSGLKQRSDIPNQAPDFNLSMNPEVQPGKWLLPPICPPQKP